MRSARGRGDHMWQWKPQRRQRTSIRPGIRHRRFVCNSVLLRCSAGRQREVIDMSMLAGLPGLIALIVCLRRGPGYAFLNVYLPVLLLLPDDYRMPISGQFSFRESAILPIAAFYLWDAWGHWEFSFTDVLLLALATVASLAEYVNTDFGLARHLMLRMLTTAIFPYVIGKGLIARDGLSVELGKRITLLATIVA